MFKKRKLIGALACALAFSSLGVTSVHAETVGSSSLSINAEATTVDITVPSSCAMVFNADGTDTLPTNFTITNNSTLGAVYLKSVRFVNNTENLWAIQNYSLDFSNFKADQRYIGIQVGVEGSEVNVASTNSSGINTGGVATLEKDYFLIPASGSKTLNFKVKRGVFTANNNFADAFNIELDFAYS